MADETRLDVELNAKVTGDAETKALADAVSSVNEAVQQLARDAQAASSKLTKVEQNVVGLVKTNKTAAAAIGATTKALQEQTKAAEQSFKLSDKRAVGAPNNGEMPAKYVAPSFKTTVTRDTSAMLGQVQALSDREALIGKQLQSQLDSRRKAVELARQLRTAEVMPKQTGTGPGSAEAVAQRFSSSGFLAAQAQNELNANLSKAKSQYDNASKSLFSYNDGLANTRYALYGLTNSLAIAGVGLLAMNVAVVAAAASFETSFANIARTAGVSGAALAQLEQQFIALGQNIPASYKDLSEIATLAGQLDIPASNISDFTKTTAMFTATTNVSVDAAATAFGRLDALLPDVQGNYNALGSSILNVGVNSVATESEIINVTNQIAAAGQQAGFSSKQVIGLAAAYASLGVAPEAARGTTVRVFSEIKTAISEGGAALDSFSKLAGTSAEEFKTAWSKDAGNTFIKVLQGLQSEGGNAEQTLRSLGITAVRDISSMLKLSQNVDIVKSAMSDAATGFDNGTKLGESFGKIAETLASKVQELINSFQALFATLGSSGLGIIGVLVDDLKNFVVWLTEAAKNPFFQTLATAIGAFTAFSGIVALATSGFGKFVAAMLAGRPVVAQATLAWDAYTKKMAVVRAENAATGVSMGGLGVKAKALGLSMKSIGIGAAGLAGGPLLGLGIVLAFEGITKAVDYFTNEMQSSRDAAKAYFTDLSGLSTAMAKDTLEVAKGATSYGEIKAQVSQTSSTTADWVGQLENATGAQIKASDATTVATTSVRDQTYAIGENTRAWYAQQVANDQTIQKIFANQSKYKATGLNVTGLVTALAKGDISGANALYDEWDKKVAAHQQKLAAATGGKALVDQGTVNQLNEVKDLIKAFAGSAGEAASKIDLLRTISSVTGVDLKTLGLDAGEAGDGVSGLADKVSTLSQVQDAFAGSNAIAQMGQDFYNLAVGIAEGGNSLDAFSSAGMTNLANLQTSIASTIDSASAMGVSATEAVAALFAQLQAQGINTAALLASLANTNLPGVSVSGVGDYLNGTKQMSSAGNQLAQALSGISMAAPRAAKSTKSVGSAAKAAAPEVKTLADYASDLGGVFDRAFTIRFGGGQALDTISTGWQAIADSTAEANQKFRDAQATLSQLASDKKINEYFLTIANNYDDVLRSGDITAKLQDINNQIADASKGAADAQAGASKELEGNSKAAIDNRKTITDLVKNYEDYIQQLASSGADQATLAAETAKAKNEFIAQATALGYSSTQIMTYAAAFDDLTVAINGVPRNITVGADTNPAKQALAEFMAQAARSKASIPVGDDGNSYNNGYNAGLLFGHGWVDGTNVSRHLVTKLNSSVPGGKVYQYYGPGGAISGEFFSKGGYTGGIGTRQIAGQVHGQEFVINAENTSRLGIPFLNALNSGKTPAVGVGTGAQLTVVELSAQDRALLQAIPAGLRLVIGNKDVAAASDAANLVAANRGAN